MAALSRSRLASLLQSDTQLRDTPPRPAIARKKIGAANGPVFQAKDLAKSIRVVRRERGYPACLASAAAAAGGAAGAPASGAAGAVVAGAPAGGALHSLVSGLPPIICARTSGTGGPP